MSLRNERIKIHQAPLKSQFHGVNYAKTEIGKHNCIVFHQIQQIGF